MSQDEEEEKMEYRGENEDDCDDDLEMFSQKSTVEYSDLINGGGEEENEDDCEDDLEMFSQRSTVEYSNVITTPRFEEEKFDNVFVDGLKNEIPLVPEDEAVHEEVREIHFGQNENFIE